MADCTASLANHGPFAGLVQGLQNHIRNTSDRRQSPRIVRFPHLGTYPHPVSGPHSNYNSIFLGNLVRCQMQEGNSGFGVEDALPRVPRPNRRPAATHQATAMRPSFVHGAFMGCSWGFEDIGTGGGHTNWPRIGLRPCHWPDCVENWKTLACRKHATDLFQLSSYVAHT